MNDASSPTPDTDQDPLNFAISLDSLIEEENAQTQADEADHVVPTPQTIGEQSASGHMPSPQADDDLTEAAHQVGLHLDDSLEEPEELNIGAEINEAERIHRQGS